MRLWTWHLPAFDLTADCVDNSRSEYLDLPGVRQAYAGLFERIGTSQVIWCLIREIDSKSWGKMAGGRLEWQLDIPVEEVLAFVNGFVWDRIIAKYGGRSPSHPPSYLRSQWRLKALQLPCEQHEQYVKSKTADYDAEPSDGWWSQLFINDRPKSSGIAEFVSRPESEAVTALIRHPVSACCVTRCPRVV